MINFNINISILGSTKAMDSMDIDYQVSPSYKVSPSYQVTINKVSSDPVNMEIDTISYIPIDPYNMKIDDQIIIQLTRSTSCPI